MSKLPSSLDALRSHAIFVPPASSSADDGWELVDAPPSMDGQPAPPNVRLAVHDKDLYVAFGKEVRMTTLSGEGLQVHGSLVGSYKTLKSPHLTFEIHQLVLNPTGRLLSVIGHHQVVILVLPRAGFASSISGDVSCRSFPVDEYQHSPSSTNAITKVRWHPWGEGGNSLWILTADATLYEYDILRPQDPVQTFKFLPEKVKTTSKFSAVDPLSQYATSFAFSRGTMDFAPLMVYTLMANGDVYTLGPLLPLHAEVPAIYLASLKAWMGERLKRLKRSSEEVKADHPESAEKAALIGRASLQAAWVDALVKQGASSGESSPVKRRGFGLKDDSPSPPPKSDRPPPPPGLVRVHPPHLTAAGGPAPGLHRPLMRQGPLLFDPAPQDAGHNDEEQCASDISVLRVGEDGKDAEEVNIVAIAWSGGRVDLCIEEDAPEPRWISSRDPADIDVVLPVVESVLTKFPSSVDEDAVQNNAPFLVHDPIHADVVYVVQAYGVEAISVAPWVSKLLEGAAELPASDVARLVEASPARPIIGAVTFCNIALGYGLLALATSGQLAAVEMDFRVQDRAVAPEPAVQEEESRSLLSKPIPAATVPATNPKAKIRQCPDSGKPLDAITPAHLRALADAASQIRTRAEAVRTASASIERRLDLQVAEYARQLQLLREAAASTEEVRDKVAANADRTEGLAAEQAKLGDRLDAVITAMLAEYRPQIGEVERKWFDELERIRARVAGSRRAPGLERRAQVLKEQLGVVRGLVTKREIEEREGMSPRSAEKTAYGHRQLRPLQAALNARSDELARMLRKMEALSVKVDEADVEDEQ